ncbi:MAG: aspartate aminotransferase family protein [Arenicellales bacterium]|nr:aspartate aminotransferase family protein [Arenicellales bacterium]
MNNANTQAATSEWQELDSRHHLHPFTDYKALKRKGSRIIVRAEGVYLWDSDGNRILDGMAGLWCVNIGYGRREMAQVASEQIQQLPYYNNFFQTTHPPSVELSRMLSEITQQHLNHVFFTCSGSEANDTVVRMVRRYWDLLGQPEKQIIISRYNAYHGSTVAAGTLGGMQAMHDQSVVLLPGVEHIMQPHWYEEGGDLSPEQFGIKAARALAEKIEQLGVDKVAAFIAEPIQGAGGVIIPPETYWPEVTKICAEYGILLVADEVICGFGRTGEWFGSDYYEIAPDLMPMAKGLSSGYLPIGGVMVSDKIAETLVDKGGEFAHGFTYSGHPVAAAVAVENIKIMQRENIVTRVRDEIGPYFKKKWAELEAHPLVGEARSLGLLGALELVKDKNEREFFDPKLEVGNRCRDICIENGLVMRAVADKMVVSPSLIIQKEQVDELVELAGKCLDLTQHMLDNTSS